MKKSALTTAFTLIELLTVVAIIAILMSLLFPAANAVKVAARRTEASADVRQIVTAADAFYADYGIYPVDPVNASDILFSTNNNLLFDVLRGISRKLNPRGKVYLDGHLVKDSTSPKSGFASTGIFYDPWGTPYFCRIDANYHEHVQNPYSQNAGDNKIATGVIAWSLGRDKLGGSGDKKAGNALDDILSWQ